MKPGGEREIGGKFERTKICRMLIPFGRNGKYSGLCLNLLCGVHLYHSVLCEVVPLLFHAPLIICCCLYNFKMEKWSVFSLTLTCNCSFS